MTTPAPHTPINLVKGGNSLFFSAECVALLARAGYSPDDFGTHEQVLKRCSDAREKCNLHDAQVAARNRAKADGVPEDQLPVVTAPAPSAHERFLASSQSSHLAQDACFHASQDSNGNPGRDNPCANDGYVDGYETRLYPCMPHQGAADEPGGQHHLVSVMENEQPVGPPANLKRGADYPRDQMDQHCHDRAQAAVDWRDQTAAQTGLAQPSGDDNVPPTVTEASQAAYFEGTDPKNAGEIRGDPKMLTGQTAAECIESFRKAGEAEMKAKCAREVSENQKAANGPHGTDDAAGAKWREDLAERASDDRAAADAAKKERTSARQSASQLRNSMHQRAREYRDNPTPENRARLNAKMNEYLTAQQRSADADRRYQALEERASESGAASSAACRAQCRYEQGRRLSSSGGGSDSRRVPGYNTHADPTPSAGTATGTT
jgi:hypothetical protein